MGYNEERCFRAVNCVDTNKVYAEIATRKPQAEGLKERLGLGASKVVLFVGAITKTKKIERLILAFSEIHGKLPNSRLILVGDGPHREALQELTKQLELSEAVDFVGKIIDGISDYFEVADLLVMPGLGGLVVSEALAHGLPVICSRGDGCEVDLVENGSTGYRIDSDSDAEVQRFIAEKLMLLLTDDDLRLELSNRAVAAIRERYNVKTYLNGICKAIECANGLAVDVCVTKHNQEL